MARDPRWGRTPETYGEDPFLAGRIGVAFVRGIQGADKKYLKSVATPKHFAANNEEHNRLFGNAWISEKALREYYFPAFKTCVQEGGAMSVMGAYNAINGVPCNANRWLLTDVLRNEWGFKGFVVTDCGAVENLVTRHKYAGTSEEAATLASKSFGQPGRALELLRGEKFRELLRPYEQVDQTKKEELINKLFSQVSFSSTRLRSKDV